MIIAYLKSFFFHFIEYFYIFLSNCPLAFHEILYQEYKKGTNFDSQTWYFKFQLEQFWNIKPINTYNFFTWQSMCLHNYFKDPALRDRLSSICMIKLSRQNTADQIKNANTFRYLMSFLSFSESFGFSIMLACSVVHSLFVNYAQNPSSIHVSVFSTLWCSMQCIIFPQY